MKNKEEYYLIRIFGDVYPFIIGPFGSDDERLLSARTARESIDEDGLYRLDIVNGKPVIDSFSGGELMNEKDSL